MIHKSYFGLNTFLNVSKVLSLSKNVHPDVDGQTRVEQLRP